MSARRCPECMSVGGHGWVHVRYGNGGGGNRPCEFSMREALARAAELGDDDVIDLSLVRGALAAGVELADLAAAVGNGHLRQLARVMGIDKGVYRNGARVVLDEMDRRLASGKMLSRWDS